MPNSYFQFKQFTIHQQNAAMKVGTDSVLLGAWANIDPINSLRALDIGTGSGILAIMLAQRFANLSIDGVEIDEQAYTQAQENVNQCPWVDRIQLYHQRFQDFVENHSHIYDLIISNPPYFIQSLSSPNQQRTMARHSDLLSQDDLLKGVLQLMKANGKFSVIFPINEGLRFIQKAESKGLFCTRKTRVRANPNKEPKRLLLEFSYYKAAIEEAELCIDTGIRHVYTPEYIELTKDFYLNF